MSRKYQRRIYLGYTAIAAFAVAAVLATEVWPQGRIVSNYGPNLAADAVGILVTLVFVERILVWQRDRALAPVRDVALRRLRIHLNRLMYMVLFSYKAAAPPGSSEEFETSRLLSAWSREARWLDFRKPYGPDNPPRSWHQYGSEVVHAFEVGTSTLLDRYLEVLGPEIAVAIENVVDHSIMNILKAGSFIAQTDAQYGFDLPRLSFCVNDVDHPDNDPLAELAGRLRDLIEEYERLSGQTFKFDARLYEDHQSPNWGSARVELSTTESTSPES